MRDSPLDRRRRVTEPGSCHLAALRAAGDPPVGDGGRGGSE